MREAIHVVPKNCKRMTKRYNAVYGDFYDAINLRTKTTNKNVYMSDINFLATKNLLYFKKILPIGIRHYIDAS